MSVTSFSAARALSGMMLAGLLSPGLVMAGSGPAGSGRSGGIAALAAPVAGPGSGPSAPATEPAQGSAYFEFMRGRHLEGLGRVTDALAAYERAAKLDPKSAEIRAEMAALHARQNQPAEAIRAAKAALAIDPDDSEAHWVLGTVFASLVDARAEEAASAAARPGAAAPKTPATPNEEPSLEAAIDHLEKARPGRRYDNGLHLTLGRLYLETEKYDKAVEVLFYVVEREPDFIEAAYLLAQAYDGAGDRPRAIATMEEVVAAEPQFSRAWVALAELYARNKQWDKSAEAYDRGAKENSDNPTDLRLRQAAALVAAGRTPAARDVLKALVKTNPNEARVLYLLAETERSLQDYDAAEATARQLMAVAPKQPFGPHALAQVYALRHQYRDIVSTLTPIVEAAGPAASTRAYAPLWVSLGQAYQEMGEFDKAVGAFERAKAAGGGDASYDAYLAQAYMTAGKPKQALDLIAALRTRQPRNLRLANLEAQARLQAGDAAGATKLLEDTVTANPRDPQAPVALASLLVEAKQYAKAEDVLNRAATQFPADIGIPFQLGAVFEEQDRPKEAEEAFRRALSIDPQHAPTLNYLGYMLAERGMRLDEALTLLNQAVKIEPFNGSYLDSLGWAYFKKGTLDKAREYLVKAGEQLPTNSVVQDHVGDVLFATRDFTGAVAAWKKALAGDGRSIDRQAIERKIDQALKK